MLQQPTQRRRTAVKSGDPVGRCCQRHVITGQVMTDWYPVRMYVEVPHNRFCKTLYCRPTRETVRRRMRRRTSSRASDKYPVQSALLCAGNYYVSGNYKCNLRLTLETEYIAQCPEKRAPRLKQPIRWTGVSTRASVSCPDPSLMGVPDSDGSHADSEAS
jgi:hypothetical protein